MYLVIGKSVSCDHLQGQISIQSDASEAHKSACDLRFGLLQATCRSHTSLFFSCLFLFLFYNSMHQNTSSATSLHQAISICETFGCSQPKERFAKQIPSPPATCGKLSRTT